jgi:hypothetical protein
MMMLRVIKYHLLESSETDRKKIGLIAQDLQEHFPELVHEDDSGYLSVDYVGLIGPVIKAVQELRTEKDVKIEQLENKLAAMDARLLALEEREEGGKE